MPPSVIPREQLGRAESPPPRASRQRSSSVAMSARLMFSPCAPIGGITCAASATSAVRGPSSRSATWAMIGQSRRGLASRSSPSTPQARAFSAASNAGWSSARSSSAAGPVSIHTTAEWRAPARSGSGTSVNGPPSGGSRSRRPRAAAVRDREDQRLLPIPPAADADAETLPHRAVAPVRRQHQPRAHLHARRERGDRLGAARRRPARPRRSRSAARSAARRAAPPSRAGAASSAGCSRRPRAPARPRRNRPPRGSASPARPHRPAASPAAPRPAAPAPPKGRRAPRAGSRASGTRCCADRRLVLDLGHRRDRVDHDHVEPGGRKRRRRASGPRRHRRR